jgi:hypothetical protein
MAWRFEKVIELGPDAIETRLTDLSLAMVIPWADGWPQYWLNETNLEQRIEEILAATAKERLPWQI